MTTSPAHVLADLGHRVRTLMNKRGIEAQADGRGWQPLDPYLLSLADRCEEWGWQGRAKEDPGALADEARAVLDAEKPPPQP